MRANKRLGMFNRNMGGIDGCLLVEPLALGPGIHLPGKTKCHLHS